jgi:hypothetical protein
LFTQPFLQRGLDTSMGVHERAEEAVVAAFEAAAGAWFASESGPCAAALLGGTEAAEALGRFLASALIASAAALAVGLTSDLGLVVDLAE